METDFFTWVNNRLEELGWTYSDLSKRGGLSRSNVSLILNGDRNVTFDFCLGLATAFGENPITILRVAGLLPPSAGKLSDLDEEELEMVNLYRALPDQMSRETALQLMRGWVAQVAPKKR